MERHERGEALVIPTIVRPADWEWTSFGRLQALPKDAKPITTWPNQDEAWLDVVSRIRRAVQDLLRERQERERAIKGRYRQAVEEAWTDERVSDAEAVRLAALASELSLSADAAADVEGDVMGDTKEVILERQEQAALKRERKERLERLYAQAYRLHRDQEWQAVVDVVEKIYTEDPDYPDHSSLLASAREALETARREEETLRQYHEAVEAAWRSKYLYRRDSERLRDLAGKLELIPDKTANIEREVMGDTKEAVRERQEQQAARERYHKAVKEAWTDQRLWV